MKFLNIKVPSCIIMFFMLVPMSAFVLLCKLEAVEHTRSIASWNYEMQLNMRVERIAMLRGRKIDKYRKHVLKANEIIRQQRSQNTFLQHKLNLAEVDAAQARQVVDVYREEVVRLGEELLNRRVESIDEAINRLKNEPEKRHNKVPEITVPEE